MVFTLATDSKDVVSSHNLSMLQNRTPGQVAGELVVNYL